MRRRYRRNRRRMSNTKSILIGILIFLGILYLADSNEISFSSITTTAKTKMASLKSDGLFSSSANDCPQLNYPLDEAYGIYPWMVDMGADGWKISARSSTGDVYCVPGYLESHNINYLYCGTQKTGFSYMTKTLIDDDGTIGKTIKKGFVNVYDKDKRFIETIC